MYMLVNIQFNHTQVNNLIHKMSLKTLQTYIIIYLQHFQILPNHLKFLQSNQLQVRKYHNTPKKTTGSCTYEKENNK